jgi:hypothetical protein
MGVAGPALWRWRSTGPLAEAAVDLWRAPGQRRQGAFLKETGDPPPQGKCRIAAGMAGRRLPRGACGALAGPEKGACEALIAPHSKENLAWFGWFWPTRELVSCNVRALASPAKCRDPWCGCLGEILAVDRAGGHFFARKDTVQKRRSH